MVDTQCVSKTPLYTVNKNEPILIIFGVAEYILYLGEESPPLPIAQFQVCAAIALDYAYSVQMLTPFLIMSKHVNTATVTRKSSAVRGTTGTLIDN